MSNENDEIINDDISSRQIPNGFPKIMRKVRALKGWLTRYINNINDTIDDNEIPIKEARKNVRELQEKVYEQRDNIFDLLYELCDNSTENDECSQEIKSIERQVTDIDNIVNSWLVDCRVSSVSSQSTSQVAEKTEDHQVGFNNCSKAYGDIKLNNLDVPKFNENENYYYWRSIFNIVVNNQVNMSNDVKMLKLLACLDGEPKNILKCYPPFGSAYENALGRLDTEYGGKKRLIKQTISAVRSGKIVEASNVKQIKYFLSVVDMTIVVMKEHDLIHELGSGTLLECAKERLSKELLTKYVTYVLDRNASCSFELLRDFLKYYLEVAEEVFIGVEKVNKRFSNFVVNEVRVTNTKPICAIHNSDLRHYIDECDIFKNYTVHERLGYVKKMNLCRICLKGNHLVNSCFSKLTKSCKVCSKDHHTMLHESNPNLQNYSTSSFNSRYSVLTVPANVSHNGKSILVNVLLDSGSNASFISKHVVDKLCINEIHQGPRQVNLLDGNSKILSMNAAKILLTSVDGKYHQYMKLNVVSKVTGELPLCSYDDEQFNEPNLHFPQLNNERPFHDVLLGSDQSFFHSSFSDVLSIDRQSIARLTPLGWTAMGRSNAKGYDACGSYSIQLTEKDEELNDLVRRSWELSAIGIDANNQTDNSNEVRKQLDESLQLIEGHYVAPILWKAGNPVLVNNMSNAEKRLQLLYKKLDNNEGLKVFYEDKINDYLNKDYIEEIAKNSNDINESWFIPHFPVVKENSKPRIVFDCSASYGKYCINAQIHEGPKEQTDLFDVLLRFRLYPIALVGDIEEMYLQIHVNKEDQKYCRFLWLDNIYQWKRLIFGRRDAPFIAVRCLKKHAETYKVEYSLAEATVRKSMYVDDIVDSCNSIEEAYKLKNELIELFSICGMKIKKWASSHPSVFNNISCIDFFRNDPVQKTLGLQWNSQIDELTYLVNDVCIKCTKRTILSYMSKIFDPLGLIEPITVKIKSLFQYIWTQNVQWDEELSNDISKKWIDLRDSIKDLSDIKIPRHIGFQKGMICKLHMFSDASIHAYSTVAYLRSTNDNGAIHCNILCSKSRVTPLKAQSIPRLELTGAVISVRLAMKITKILDLDLKKDVIFWVDATNVLYWITQPSKLFKSFVANRVSEIQENTNTTQWRHCPGKQNPADVSTRGLDTKTLKECSIWWKGPEFLHTTENTWPKIFNETNKLEGDDEKRKEDVCLGINIHTMSDVFKLHPCRWSNLNKLLIRISYVLKGVKVLLNRFLRRTNAIEDLQELKIQAEEILIRISQSENFATELQNMKNNKSIPKTSNLVPHNVFLDLKQIIRANTRVVNAEWLPFDVKYPILLPKNSDFTRLVISNCHESLGHAVGTNMVISEISNRYWILRIREAVREYEHKCNKCKILKAKVFMPKMASIPRFRLSKPFFPFSKCGIDFAGPFLTKAGRGKARNKRYACLFTCLQVRAVHLEVLTSLETDCFLNAMSRFIARRGTPNIILTDNGTTFVRANKEINILFKKLETNSRHKNVSNIKWLFNPPYGPHFGGIFERLIKSMKRALNTIMLSDVNDEELITLLINVEGMLNSRPLCPPSCDSSDLPALTPNHFLQGRNNNQLFVSPELDINHPMKRWRYINVLLDDVWKRWMKEVIRQLSPRTKWLDSTRSLETDDIVLEVMPCLPRSQWRMSRVVATHPGNDGIVRVVTIKQDGKTFQRPVSRLCPLEFDEHESS